MPDASHRPAAAPSRVPSGPAFARAIVAAGDADALDPPPDASSPFSVPAAAAAAAAPPPPPASSSSSAAAAAANTNGSSPAVASASPRSPPHARRSHPADDTIAVSARAACPTLSPRTNPFSKSGITSRSPIAGAGNSYGGAHAPRNAFGPFPDVQINSATALTRSMTARAS
eukprot:29120-Pelagococcus_subviridis.AAC.3